MQTRVILVEGVPFTGKSTLSEWVAQQLPLNGIPSTWVPEGEMLQQYFRHVLAVLDQQQSVSEDVVLADCSAFVETVMHASTTFVVDSALSYAALLPLMAADRPSGVILAQLQHIADLCAPLHPRVIHLTGDVDRLAHASIVERGEEWEEHLVGQSDAAPYQQARGRSGLDGAIAFLQETQALMHRILETSSWQTLTLDVTGSAWDANRRAMLALLGIAEVQVEQPTLGRMELQAYAGTYAAQDPEARVQQLSVQLEQDTLSLYGPRSHYGTLIPLTTTRFHVRATRADTEFVVENGRVQRLMLFTSDGKTLVFRRT